MFLGFILFTFLMVGLIIFAVEIGIPRLLIKLGAKDVWWSPVRTDAPPGKVIMMVKANERGSFACLYHDVPYRIYDHVREEFTEELDPSDPRLKKTGYLAELGLVWVGFNRAYYKRQLRYDSWEKIPGDKDGQFGIVPKESNKGEEHFFNFATTMAIKLNEVPAKGFYPVSLVVQFNTLLMAPRRAEFLAGKWEVQASAEVQKRSQEYISGKTVKELRVERDTDRSDDFVDYVLQANEGTQGAAGTVPLLRGYGIKIDGPKIIQPDYESGDAEMVAAERRTSIAEADVLTASVRVEEARLKGLAKSEERSAEAPGIEKEFAARASVPGGETFTIAEAIGANGGLKALAINTKGIMASVDANE